MPTSHVEVSPWMHHLYSQTPNLRPAAPSNSNLNLSLQKETAEGTGFLPYMDKLKSQSGLD